MPDLTIPDVEVIVKTNAAIPQRNRPGFLVCDTLGDLVTLGMGDSQGLSLQNLNPTISDDWLSAGTEAGLWKLPDNVCFFRFLKDGVFREGNSAKSSDPNSDLFGIAIRARLAHLDSKIGGTSLDGGFTDLNWEEVQGDWESVKPPGAPQYLKIRPVGSTPTHKARTVGNLPANRSLFGEANFVAQGASSNQAASRFIWGGEGEGALSLCWRHGQKITVERKVGGVWRVLRALDMEPANMRGGRYVFYIRRLAGRLCITINGHNFHDVLISEPVSGRAKPIDYFWPEGKLQFNCFHVRGTLGVGIVKYASPADVVYEGTFGRIVRRSVPVRTDETGVNIPEVKFKGWARDGTNAVGQASLPTDYAVDYDVVMTANTAGIDTPFISCVMVRFAPQWTSPSISGIDLRPGIKTMRVTLPSIPSAPYSEVSIDLDRQVLDQAAPGWESYVNRYYPITVRARRKYDDGTYYDADWKYLFKGYIYKIDKSTSGANDQQMTLVCRDESLRLQRPAAVIDHRYPPLDILFAYADASSPLSLALYGSDGVREILRRAVGDTQAAALTTYFPASHYPLLDFYGDSGGFLNVQSALTGQPPTTGNWFFPAPYGEDAISWIGKLAEFDKAVFFYGNPGGLANSYPVPIYGRIPQILAAMNSVTIPDAYYLSGDKEKLLLQVSTETRPDRDINRVLAWANFANTPAPDFIPAYRMGADQLEMPDINAPERTWERTLVIKEDFGQVEGGVEAIAQGVILLLGDSEMKWPQFLTRGNPNLHWGTSVTFKMVATNSDETIDLHDETFRCERVEHVFDLTSSAQDWWVTSVQARPTSRGIF